jgi:hypothetical protein
MCACLVDYVSTFCHESKYRHDAETIAYSEVIARNCHKSRSPALSLGNLRLVLSAFLYPSSSKTTTKNSITTTYNKNNRETGAVS